MPVKHIARVLSWDVEGTLLNERPWNLNSIGLTVNLLWMGSGVVANIVKTEANMNTCEGDRVESKLDDSSILGV